MCLCGDRNLEIGYDMEPSVVVHVWGPSIRRRKQEDYCKFHDSQHLKNQMKREGIVGRREGEKERNDKRKERENRLQRG